MSAWMQQQQARIAKPAVEETIEDVAHQRISLYKEPPIEEVCIEEFERFAIDRLRGRCAILCKCALIEVEAVCEANL